MSTQKLSFRYYLNLGEGRFADILVDQITDPSIEAAIIAKKYQFSNQVAKAIGDSIKEQIAHQKGELILRSAKNQQGQSQSRTQNFRQNFITKQKIAPAQNNCKKKHQKSVMKIKKYITQAANQQQYDDRVHQINEKANGNKEKQQNYFNFFNNQNQNQSKSKMVTCPSSEVDIFKLRIDKLLERQSSKQNSRVSFSGHKTSVFENLYKKHKEIQTKKELLRNQSNKLNTFKPQINKHSKKIIQDRRAKLWSVKNSLQKQKKNQLPIQNSCKKTATTNHAVNQISFKVFQEKKKEKTPQKLKILPRSQQLVDKCRKQSFKQIFNQLLIFRKDSEKRLFFSDINFSKLTQKQKMLLPIFQQLKHFSFGINQAQFIEGCLKFMQNLPQSDKVLLGSKKKIVDKQNSKTKNSRVSSSKKFKTQAFELNCSSILKDKLNIYERGSIYQKKSADKRSRIKQNQSSKLMQNCTFRPVINLQK